MRVLAPLAAGDDWRTHLDGLRTAPSLRSFDDAAIAFARDLSRRILLDDAFRAFPELMAMAHALRPVEIDALRRRFAARTEGRLVLPRGTVVHFAPSNVDTIFVHSWLLSMLVGNANVVRLSTRRGPQVEALVALVAGLLAAPAHAEISKRTLIVGYDHEQRELTEALSADADVRVIWGGDATIRAVRAVPLPPMSTEVVFADRFSLAAIRAEVVRDLAEDALARLVTGFANDALWFDQRACSSPRLVAWVGGADARAAARRRFWPAFAVRARAQDAARTASAVGIARLTNAAWFAAAAGATHVESEGATAPVRVDVPRIDPAMREMHGGAGLFLELELDSLDALAPTLTAKDQTLSVFGFTHDELAAWVRTLPRRAVDRIVPVGRALEFDAVWDGYDLLLHLTREVSLAT